MIKLERITTEYIVREDRIRLSGERADGATVSIWLTQHLLSRLLPLLLQWIERQCGNVPRAETLHSFVQQMAKAELTLQRPVRAIASRTAWLARSVDVAQSRKAVRLTFRGEEDQNASLTLAVKPLRQWLGIVHDAYCKANWPLAVWPGWIRESALPAQKQAVVLH